MEDIDNYIYEADPAPPLPEPTAPAVPHRVASSAAILESHILAESPQDKQRLYQEHLDKITTNRYEWAEEVAAKQREMDLQAMSAYIDSGIGTIDQSQLAVDVALLDEDSQNQTDPSNPLTPYLHQVRNMMPSANEVEIKERAFSLMAEDTLAHAVEGSNLDGKWGLNDFGLSSLSGIAGLMFNPMQTDLSQLGVHNWSAFVKGFNEMPAEERALVLLEMSNRLDEVGTSPIKKASILSTLTDAQSGQAFATSDQVFDVLTAAGAVTSIYKGVNAVSKLSKLKQYRDAALMNKAAGSADEAAIAVGLDPHTPVDNALFWKNADKLNPQALGDASKINNEQLKLTQATAADAEAFRKELLGELSNVKILQPESVEVARIRQTNAAQIQALEDQALAMHAQKFPTVAPELVVTDVVVEEGGKVRVVASAKGSTDTAHSSYGTLKELPDGTFGAAPHAPAKSSKDGGTIQSFVTSPSTLFEDAVGKNAMTNDATQAMLNDVRLRTVLTDRWATVFDPIRKGSSVPKASWSKLESVIKASDSFGGRTAAGKRFAPHELANGIDTVTGRVVLSPEEIKAYYRYFEFTDTLGFMQNLAKRDVMAARGVKQAKSGQFVVNGIPLSKADTTKYINSGKAGQTIIGPDGHIVELKNLKNTDDLVIVQLDEELIAEGSVRTHMAVNAREISDLPAIVTSRREAYFPIVRSGTQFVIREYKAGKVDDLMVGVNPEANEYAYTAVHQLHGSKSEAEASLAKLLQEAPEGVTYRLEEESDLAYTGRAPLVQREGVGRSARSSRDITAGVVSAPEQLPLAEAMEKYIGVVAKDTSLSRWRYEHLTRLQDMVRTATGNRSWRLGDAIPEGKQFNDLRNRVDYTKAILNTQTADERLYERFAQRLGNYLDGKGFLKAGKYVNNLSYADPVQAVRAANYHLKLGMLNLSQLIVQSSNIALAASLYPVQTARVTRDYFAVRQLMNIRSPAARSAVISRAVKDGVVSKDFAERWARFERTGIEFASTNNPDMAMAYANMPTTMAGYKKLLHHSGMFVREGETFSQIMGWMVADQLAKEGKIAKGLKGADLDRAVAEHSRLLTMNISKANRARFEENKFTALGTQFTGVVTKFAELGLPKSMGGTARLTNTQKFQVVLGQFALFGAVGTTMTDGVASAYAAATGRTVADLTDTEVKGVEAGMFGMLLPEIDLSRRLQLLPDLESAWYAMYLGDSDMFSMALGATESTLGQSYRALRGLTAFVVDTDGNGQHDPELLKIALKDLARMASSYSNAEKAYIMARFNELRMRSTGAVVYRDPETIETIFQGIGISPSRAADFYDAKIQESTQRRLETKFIKEMVRNYNDYTLNAEDTPEKWKMAWERMQAMSAAYSGGDPIKHHQLMEKFLRSLQDSKKSADFEMARATLNKDLTNQINTIAERKQQGEAKRYVEYVEMEFGEE